tara:strand:+ start:1263 stop:1742 length:480 start_codon:yes stop_codon:yes gene_type:complete
MNDDLDDTVDGILDQLRANNTVIKKIDNSPEVTKENLEAFILKHTSELVKSSSEAVELVKDYVTSAPNAEDVTALADLVKATATAVNTLNSLLSTEKKNNTLIRIKEMDINSRKEELNTAIGVKLLLTREELMKQLLNSAQLIEDAKIINVDLLEIEND